MTKTQLQALLDIGTLRDAKLTHRSLRTVQSLVEARAIEFDVDSFVLTDYGIALVKDAGRWHEVEAAYGITPTVARCEESDAGWCDTHDAAWVETSPHCSAVSAEDFWAAQR